MQITAHRSSAMRIFALAAAISVSALATPHAVSAAGCQGAPGTSALEQYCEAIPDAKGGRQDPGSSGSGSGSGSSTGSGSSGSGVSSQTAKTLSQSGTDGAAVEALAGGASSDSSSRDPKTSKKPSSKTKSTESAGSGSGGADASVSVIAGTTPVTEPADPSSSPLKATTNAVAGGPTVGGGLVWGLLGMSALGAIGAVLLRRHRHTLDPPAED